MRIATAVAICIVILGGMTLYMSSHDSAARHRDRTVEAVHLADADYTVEVTATFDLEPDPFALTLDDRDDPPVLRVALEGKDIVRETKNLPAGIPLRSKAVTGLREGINEFYVEAAVPEEDSGKSAALRIRLLTGDRSVAEHTIWSDGDVVIAGVFRADLGEETGERLIHE